MSRVVRATMDGLESRRLLTFGEVEPLFGGGDGMSPVGASGDVQFDLVALPDGRYYTIGRSAAVGSELVIRRFRADGSLDTAFGASGSTTLPLPGEQDWAQMTVDANGSLVVATTNAVASTSSTTLVARVLPSGLFDSTFASIGYRNVELGGYDLPNAVATFGNTIIVGGTANQTGGDADWAFARLLGNGTLDPSFSDDGLATLTSTAVLVLEDLVVQADGKVVGVGRSQYGSSDARMIVHRLNANGTSDGTFGTGGGWREYDLPNTFESFRSAAVHGDRLYLVGDYESVFGGGRQRGVVVAMNISTGTVDTSFNPVFPTPTNGNGLLSFSFDPAATDSSNLPTNASTTSDGRLLIGGTHWNNLFAQPQLACVAITPAGTLDPTFDGDGRRVLPMTGQNNFAMSVAADQSVLLLGTDHVARLRGMLDLSYGTGGTSTLNLGGNPFNVVATHVLPDGKTVAALSARGGDLALYVARFNVDGSLDTGFGNANPIAPGLARIAGTGGLLGEIDSINTIDMLVEPDGQIVVAGVFARVNTSFVTVLQQVAVGRFNANGSIDRGFGVNGLALVEGDYSNEVVTSVVIAADGDILVGGYQGSPLADVRPLLVRLTDAGAPDASFDADGVLSPLFNTVAITRYNTRLMDLVVRPNGNIVYVGGWQSSPTGTATANGMVVELLPTGAPNTAFGFGGFGDAGTGSADRLFSVALQPDGKIVAAGHFAQVATVIRVNSTGFYDSSFGVGGIATGPGVGNGLFDVAGGVDLVIQPDTRIVASAITTAEIPGLPGESAIWRLTADGTLDKSFQPFDGVGELGKSFNFMVYAIAQQSDGKVIIAGTGNDVVLRRMTVGQFQAVSAQYMINGYNGVATYPTWRVRLSEPVDFSSVAITDFAVFSLAGSSGPPSVVPASQLAWQTTSDPREIDLYYTGPNGPANFVWPKGYFIVGITGGSILSTSGSSVAATQAGFSAFRVLPGDFDNNGTVNFNDLLILAQNYNGIGKLNAQGDATYDGVVNFNDLLILAQNYNQSLIAASPRTTDASKPRATSRKGSAAADVLA